MHERKTRLEVVIADRPAQMSIREWRVPKSKGQVICFHGFGVNGSEYAPMAERLNRMETAIKMGQVKLFCVSFLTAFD